MSGGGAEEIELFIIRVIVLYLYIIIVMPCTHYAGPNLKTKKSISKILCTHPWQLIFKLCTCTKIYLKSNDYVLYAFYGSID